MIRIERIFPLWRVIILVFVSNSAIVANVEAKQLAHNLDEDGVFAYFSYQWNDMHGATHDTEFKLPVNDTLYGANEFQRYDAAKARRYILNRLHRDAAVFKTKGIVVNLTPTATGIKVKAAGNNGVFVKQALDNLRTREERYRREFIKSIFYAYINDNILTPDHVRIAKRYVKAMAPVAQALDRSGELNDRRSITNHVLNFLQSIPYDTLKDRRSSNGAGFQTPYGLLSGNKGDCDSKSVAFAAIMRNFYPEARMLIVYVPGYALVGFDFVERADDYVIGINGTNFILAEPVGPDNTPLGQISDSALESMSGGKYFYKEVPF